MRRHDPIGGAPKRVELSLRESDAFLQREEEKLLRFKRGLDSCNQLTKHMAEVLTGFEHRFAELQQSMMPIHTHTKRITLAQSSIAYTIREAENFFWKITVCSRKKSMFGMYMAVIKLNRFRFRVATKTINGCPRGEKLDDYIDWVDQVCQGIDYFEANSKYKQADKYLKQLRELCDTANQNLEERFSSELRDASRPLNPGEYPVSEDYRPISIDRVEQLSKIAVTLDNTSMYLPSVHKNASGIRSNYCTTLKKQRSHLLVKSLKTSFRERPDEDFDEREGKITAARPYEKGSHPFVFHIHFYVQLLELERDLLSDILSATGCSMPEQDSLFVSLASDSMEMLFRKAQEVMQQKLGPNKVLVLLDVLETWGECMPKMMAILCKVRENSGFGATDDHNLIHRLRSTQTDFQQASRSEIEARREAVQQHPHKDVRPDGGYHALTLSTIQFLRQLLEYAPAIETLYPTSDVGRNGFAQLEHSVSISMVGLGHDDPMAPKKDPTRPENAMTDVVSKYLAALQANIQAKSNQYKVPSLVHIFLLNNYHYISKNVRESALIDVAGSGFTAGYQRDIVKARTAYQKESWTKALQALLIKDFRWAKINPEEVQLTNSERKTVKNKFLSFNEEFERCYNAQKQFSVPDSDLRSQLRNENVELVVAAYGAFEDVVNRLDFTTNRGKYMKYRAQSLEQMLNRFFDEDA